VFAADPERVGYPWDWSHEHLLFSHTSDPAVLAIIQKDPRAFHQWPRRNRLASQEGAPISFDTFLQSDFMQPKDTFASPSLASDAEPRSGSDLAKQSKRRDWGVSLGATKFSNVNATNTGPIYPAKYNFNINSTPSCLLPTDGGDYVAFPTGANGKTSTNTMNPNGQASIVAYYSLYSTQPAGGLCDTDGPLVGWSYVNAACPATMSSDPILSPPVISMDGTKVAWVTSTGKVQIVTYGVGVTSGGAETVLSPACIGPSSSGGDGGSLQTVTLVNSKETGPKVSVSALYVDYKSDAAYVGDDDGYLHKISPFFHRDRSASGTNRRGLASLT
jgi:hypothetical protein